MGAIMWRVMLAGCGLGVVLSAVGCGGGRTSSPASPVSGVGRPATLRNSLGMELVLIPAGTFRMGSADGDDDELVHWVRLTKPFYLGVTEVTNAQWEAVMGEVPSHWQDADRPVEQVSWNDAVAFCRKLSELPAERAAGREYRLPTEAEWEYACRAGSKTAYSFGDDAAGLGEHGWFANNSGTEALDADALLATKEIGKYVQQLERNDCQTHPVGKKKPNAWGLHDMHGNVWEWCSDWYGEYPAKAATDPAGPAGGSGRVSRGGGWRRAAGLCRSAIRNWFVPGLRYFDLGFRLALSPSGAQPPEAGQ